jgi:uncharacterized membrane protein
MRTLAPIGAIIFVVGTSLSLVTERKTRLEATAGLLIIGGLALLGASLGGIP